MGDYWLETELFRSVKEYGSVKSSLYRIRERITEEASAIQMLPALQIAFAAKGRRKLFYIYVN
ncbi:hypothetical protein ASG81_04880 [Paenibacillus sp. Soil522]|nr:hypothetical protein ASG81_04880 [Paenibacillus sp. Soil522]